uniref:Uncharacterized protein n=1 Tax=viral metagenome TaxID=1070528 RepID=A0A6C0DR12_9ZZZZ
MKLKNILWITLVIIFFIVLLYIISNSNNSLGQTKVNEGFDATTFISAASSIWTSINMNDQNGNLVNKNSIEYVNNKLYRTDPIVQLKTSVATILNSQIAQSNANAQFYGVSKSIDTTISKLIKSVGSQNVAGNTVSPSSTNQLTNTLAILNDMKKNSNILVDQTYTSQIDTTEFVPEII